MRLIALLPFALTACAAFPALDGTISDAARQAPYPELTPVPVSPEASASDDAAFAARIAALQARAARIRQIDMSALQ